MVYVNGTLTVGQATLTVTAGNASRAYGVANPAFTASATGAINGDTFSFTESTTAYNASPVGTYAIVPVATGTNLANYTVVYVNGTLTVGQATLTVTAGNASRAYGVANPAFTASATGAINGDTFSFTESTTATTSSPVGTYAIVPVATGTNLANYTVVYVNGTLTVGQATLTVTAGNASRAYGVANPVFSAIGDRRGERRHLQLHREHDRDDELSCRNLCDRSGGDWCEPRELHRGLRQRHPDRGPGDPDGDRRQRQPRLWGGQPGVHRIATGALNGDTFSFTESTTATASSPVGTYPIVPVATGANLANYTVVYVNGTLTVGQATLTVTAGNASRAYGVANPAFTASATGAIERRHLQLHREHDSGGQLAGRDLCDRSGRNRSEPRQLHRGLRERHPDRGPGHPDGDCGQRQPRLWGGQPGVLPHRRPAR